MTDDLHSYTDTYLDQRRARNLHWSRLKRAAITCPTDHAELHGALYFPIWLEKEYGLKMHVNNDGMITTDYTVVDETKYSMYLLKFG